MFKSKKVKQGGLSDALPVYLYDNHKLVLKDGRVGVAFKLTPVEMELWDPDQYTACHVAFQAALKVLPPGTVVQKTDVYYDRPYVHPPAPGQYFSSRMGQYFGNRMVLYHSPYLFLSFAPVSSKSSGKPSGKKEKPPRPVSALNALINNVDQKLPDNPFESVTQTLALADQYTQEFIQAMRGIPDITLERMDEHQIRALYLQFLNLDFDRQPQHYERELYNEVGTLAVGEQKVSCVSLTGQGLQMFPCVRNNYGVTSPMLYPLTHFLAIPHILTQSIQVVDTKAELETLDRDKTINKSLSKLATQDNHLRVAEIDAFSAEVRAEGKQLCKLHVSLLTWETQDALRKENVEKAAAAMRSMFSSEAAVENFLTLPLFFAALPCNGYQVPDRWLPTTTDRAACYVHWTTTFKSARTGEYICDRFRNLVRINLFDVTQDNQNSITIGPSGSGKSYTMGNFIAQRYENGARQIIIDVGGSYRNTCQSLNGPDFDKSYFEYDPANPIEFAPFFVPRDAENKWLYTDEKLNFHLALLAALWKSGKDGVLTKSERAILSRFLQDYYATLNKDDKLGHHDENYPGMQSFYNFVQDYHERMTVRLDAAELEKLDPYLLKQREQYRKDSAYIQMDEFFLVLGEYVEGGRYAKVLNAKLDVDLSDYRLICFDMLRVKADPTLYPVVAMLITELSLDLFRKFPHDVKYILMDEAWSMLSGALEDFIVNMYRTIRKTNGSIGIITQGIKEIVESPIGYTLIDNSATKIILRHTNEASLERLEKPMGFTSHEMSLIRSIQSGEGWRQFLIKQGPVAKIYTLEAAPALNAILSSRAADRNLLNSLVTHYQRRLPVAVLDPQTGRPKIGPDGLPEYSTIIEQRLDFAVDEFVSSTSK
ncbi:hypothetical protein LRS06_21595 [Hymenobacter sp. J193]|uniref:VirB4 family type IV secretion system protein n=1 Tax=Hymenobacter sp. J193 TaxID=2898429 RepID=UPI0021510887|nr:hypothetical protein [Hymenobacter sp. J193]MCR5890324.1 hypothetical protein [Hymenobacter sp. J193]